MLHLLFLLPIFNVYFIIDLILVLIINTTWLIGLIMLKARMPYEKFDCHGFTPILFLTPISFRLTHLVSLMLFLYKTLIELAWSPDRI